MNEGNKKKTVLAVDDVAVNLVIMKNLLSNYFDVRVAKSGELALSILNNLKVDLLLLDVEMPGMSGFELAESARKIPGVSEIPVIFVTSHSDKTIYEQAIGAGAADIISKPIQAPSLLSKISSVLDMPELLG